MSKVINSLPMPFLDPKKTFNNSEIIADIPRILSGNASSLYILSSGDSSIDTNSNAPNSIKTPSGSFGHDHSGGNWGKVFRRSIFSYSRSEFDNVGFGGGLNDEYSSKLEVHKSSHGLIMSPASINSSDLSTAFSGIIKAYIPNCDFEGAYNSLNFSVKLFKRIGSGLQVGDTVTLEVINSSNSDFQIFDVSSTISTASVLSFSAAGIAVNAGEVNQFKFKIKYETSATSSLRISEFAITEFNLYSS